MSAAADPAGIAHPRYRVRSMLGVQVPMRDGVRLATDVYLPDGAGRYPVILIRTPYNKNNEAEVADAIFFASRGYAVAIQDCRGRFDSDGEWTPFVNEALDGYDARPGAARSPGRAARWARAGLLRRAHSVDAGAAAQSPSRGDGAPGGLLQSLP